MAIGSDVRAIDGIDALLRRVVETAHQPCLGVGSICEFGVSGPDLAEVHTPLAKKEHVDESGRDEWYWGP